jgi:predicted  nucleic acid-binding Zn-ribbon protein
MADQDENQNGDVNTSALGDITDDEAEQLLADAVDTDVDKRDQDVEHLGDRGKRALERMKESKKAAEKKAAELEERLSKYENENKSELQRLQEERDKLRESSTKAVSEARAMRVAMDAAPEHATLAHVRAVAKRVRGEDDDELQADAEELFALLAPESKTTKTPQRPKERLKGGSAEPDDEPEENDPRKLASLLPRRR